MELERDLSHTPPHREREAPASEACRCSKSEGSKRPCREGLPARSVQSPFEVLIKKTALMWRACERIGRRHPKPFIGDWKGREHSRLRHEAVTRTPLDELLGHSQRKHRILGRRVVQKCAGPDPVASGVIGSKFRDQRPQVISQEGDRGVYGKGAGIVIRMPANG